MDVSIKIEKEAYVLLDVLKLKLLVRTGKYLSKKELLSMIVKHYAKRLHQKDDQVILDMDGVPDKKDGDVQ